MVHLVVLACDLRMTTKKGRQLFDGKKCTPPEKILATPMNLPTPGKNPAGGHGDSVAHDDTDLPCTLLCRSIVLCTALSRRKHRQLLIKHIMW